MKNPRPDVNRAGAGSDNTVRPDYHLPFTILKCQRVSFGTKVAQAVIEIVGLGNIKVEAFQPTDGRPFYMHAKALCDKRAGWQRTVFFEVAFQDALTEALSARLSAESESES